MDYITQQNVIFCMNFNWIHTKKTDSPVNETFDKRPFSIQNICWFYLFYQVGVALWPGTL